MAEICSNFHGNELVCEADSPPAEEVRARIEVVVRVFLQSLMESEPSIPSMSLICRNAKNTLLRARGGCLSESPSIFLSHATFERSFTSDKGLKGYLRVWKVLELCYQLLGLGKRATLREIYYILVSDTSSLFQVQRQVNAAIQDVVALLHCSRHSLGILASSRGALVGRLLIQEPDGEVINCMTLKSHARVISGDITYLEKLKYKSDARYILVVEKEAIFQRLAEDRFFMMVPSIIITGKGYPDLATRVVLHSLHKHFPSLPIMALVDWNPAGLAIICTYKFGSMTMGLESPRYVCDVKWLGLRSKDIPLIPHESQLDLKGRDKTIAKGLLASKMLENQPKHREELHKMLNCGKRIEIEALYAHGYAFLGKIISQKIVQHDYI
ncbi:unnamed protein product [Calypogeia fissa]